ncbi:hypothetical protein MPSEU_000792800 [Mayamaea pseudoterrestris]|nr:hypothetical protein MPSEU_000792800 [Mayamaea pseudoterrestris]
MQSADEQSEGLEVTAEKPCSQFGSKRQGDALLEEEDEPTMNRSMSSLEDRNVDPSAPSTCNVILSLDIGSSSVRCSAYQVPEVESLYFASRKLRAIQPQTGKVRVDAICKAVDACVDECIQQLRKCSTDASNNDNDEQVSQPNQYKVIAVGISSFAMNLIGLNAQHSCASDDATLSYACHTDAVVQEVAQLQADFGAESLADMYQRTGAPVHAAYALAQLRVMYDNGTAATTTTSPGAANRRSTITQFTTLSSLLISRWTGQNHLPISYSEASWTGLMNVHTCTYDETVLSLLPDECVKALPRLVDFDNLDIPEGLSSDSAYFIKWPELRATKWFLGVGDGACANLGSKCSIPARIACTVGTSAAARVTLSMPKMPEETLNDNATAMKIPQGLFCYRINRDYCLLGGALTDGGSVVEWLSQLLNLPRGSQAFEDCMTEVEELVKEDLEAVSLAGTDKKTSLTILPFLSGERSTGYRSRATGAMLGLTRETTPAHMVKACLEGVTLRLSAIVTLIQSAIASSQQLNDGSIQPPRILASGQALEANNLWRQMISDCTGLSVIFDDDTQEATSRGVVFLLLRSLESQPATRGPTGFRLEVVQSMRECRPRQQARGYWKRAAAAQDEFMNAIFPLSN